MEAEEIFRAQSPLHGWESQSRAFRPDAGVDGVPRWGDFADPLEAISARARQHAHQRKADMAARQGAGPFGFARSRFSAQEERAMRAMGLPDDADRKALRTRYTLLVRQYHPDHNGGDRSHEVRLREVLDAYKVLRGARAFS